MGQLLVVRCELTAQFDHGSHRSEGIIFVDGRYPEDGHKRVTDEVLDGTPVSCNDIRCGADVPPDEPSERFKVQTRARAGGR